MAQVKGCLVSLSDFLETFSTNLIEISNRGEWIDSIYFSNLMARTRKMVRMEEGPRTSDVV